MWHLTTCKTAHAKALANSGVKEFGPYCLRHTALTMLGVAAWTFFTLKTIAGHSSITITQRYTHTQKEAIERAFGRLGSPQFPPQPLNAKIGAWG